MSKCTDLRDKGVQHLNAQFWLLNASCQLVVRRARKLNHLNGWKYESLVAVALEDTPAARRIRLTSKRASVDLSELASAASSWLPAYFSLLSKSLAESTIRDIVDSCLLADAVYRANLSAYRKLPSGKKLTKERALQSLVQAASRGDFAEFEKVFPLPPAAKAKLRPLAPRLKLVNRLRNRIVHDLGDHMTGTPGKSIKGWTRYTAIIQTLVRVLDAHI